MGLHITGTCEVELETGAASRGQAEQHRNVRTVQEITWFEESLGQALRYP